MERMAAHPIHKNLSTHLRRIHRTERETAAQLGSTTLPLLSAHTSPPPGPKKVASEPVLANVASLGVAPHMPAGVRCVNSPFISKPLNNWSLEGFGGWSFAPQKPL